MCEYFTSYYRVYNLNTDLAGAINWDNAIITNGDFYANTFVGITERYSTANTQYEYYGVISSSVGIIAIKMDNSGNPAWPGALDEFIYNSPGSAINAGNIGFLNVGTGYDEGLHIFGTDNNGGTAAHFLANAYFSGNDGCNTPGFHYSSSSAICTQYANALNAAIGLSRCTAVSLSSNVGGSDISSCGPYSSVSNSSNNRLTGLTETATNHSVNMEIFPNPAVDKITIKCSAAEILKIVVLNLQGQVIFEIRDEIQNNKKQFEIILTNKELAEGLYNVKVVTNQGVFYKPISIQN